MRRERVALELVAARSAPARGTTPSSSPSAQVSQPLIAYQAPPTNTALPPPMPGPPARSVTSGSAAAGDCEEPIRAGPPSAAGAPTPVRKRRMFADERRAPAAGSGTPARIAQGCGSPKIAPVPIWRSPA